MEVFGNKEPAQKYIKRNAVYGVCIINNEIVTVRVRDSIFLPGGGVEPDETKENAIIREFREELGWNITIISKLGTARQYFRSYDGSKFYLSIGTFYFVKKIGKDIDKLDLDHELYYLPINNIKQLQFDYFKWACIKALKLVYSK